MEVRFRLVDVFTERPFAGNQLCVVPEPPPELTDDKMQMLAREIGFSETTFVTEAGGDRYAMRIFTPTQELPFAGHPTLGTAFTMVAEGHLTSPVVQTTKAGDVPVEIDVEAGIGWMRQLTPEFGSRFDDRDLLARACGLSVDDLHPDLPAQVISPGLAPLLIPIRDQTALRRAERDDRGCKEIKARGARPFRGFLRHPRRGRCDGPDVRSIHGYRRGPGKRLGGRAARRVPRVAQSGRNAWLHRGRARRDGRQAELPARRRATE